MNKSPFKNGMHVCMCFFLVFLFFFFLNNFVHDTTPLSRTFLNCPAFPWFSNSGTFHLNFKGSSKKYFKLYFKNWFGYKTKTGLDCFFKCPRYSGRELLHWNDLSPLWSHLFLPAFYLCSLNVSHRNGLEILYIRKE